MENQNTPLPIQDEIKLSDYLRIILQYRYLVILVFTLVLVATYFLLRRVSQKIYSASARNSFGRCEKVTPI